MRGTPASGEEVRFALCLHEKRSLVEIQEIEEVRHPLLKEGASCFFHRLDPRYRVTVSTRFRALRGVSVFCGLKLSQSPRSCPDKA
jgi:hypothetical protein